VFVSAGALLFAVGLFMIGDRQMAFSKKFVVYAEFPKITGLQPGAIIRVSGAKAGSVKEILPPKGPIDKFRARLEVTESLHPLVRTDSVATIQTEGLVGGTFLGISTGTEQAPPAPDGSTIAGRDPFEIADLLDHMRDVVNKVNVTIDDLKGDVQHAIQAIATTVDNANDVITNVGGDVKTMTTAGARISVDVADISNNIRSGKGTIGKLVNDDELYRRVTAVAHETEQIAANTRRVVEQARQTLDSFQSKEGPIQGVTSNLRQTLDDARSAMAGFAENMAALKHNFLFRGFFKDRGYYDLANLSPAEYRRGALTNGNQRRALRVWLRAEVLFEETTDGAERLTAGGKVRLESAMAPYLEYLGGAVVIVEGYAQHGTADEQYVWSRARAMMVRDYLIGKFSLDPQATGLVPLSAGAVDSPAGARWDGIALAFFVEKGTFGETR
jgi:phospholipid/cholesterol/gamma-HCH transport system substrate-binding protein